MRLSDIGGKEYSKELGAGTPILALKFHPRRGEIAVGHVKDSIKNMGC